MSALGTLARSMPIDQLYKEKPAGKAGFSSFLYQKNFEIPRDTMFTFSPSMSFKN